MYKDQIIHYLFINQFKIILKIKKSITMHMLHRVTHILVVSIMP